MRSYQTNLVYQQIRFNNGLTWGYAALWVLLSIQFQPFGFKPIILGIGVLNLFVSFMHHWLLQTVKKDDFHAELKLPSVTAVASILLVSLLIGNIFAFISGIITLKKTLTTSLIYSIYMVLVDVFVIAVTVLNLFKPFVSNTFLPLFYLMIAALIFHSLVLSFGQRWFDWQPTVQKITLFILALTGLIGNILVFFVAASLYQNNKPDHIGKRQTSIREKLIKNQAALLGLLFITFLIMLAITCNWTFSYSFAVQNDYSSILQSPSFRYPFGTDNYGRDVFSRIVFGTQISLSVGLIATAIPLAVGGTLGAVSGFYGRTTDNVIMRLLDVLYAIPGMLLAITIIAAFGASTTNLVIALSLGSIPSYARTMRANVMQVSNLDYIESARALGQTNTRIISRHVIPNAMAPMIVRSTLTIGTAVISTSSLSYLGLGVEAHIPEWGNILRIGSQYLETSPYLAIYPGLAIILLVLSFNFLGDGIRDATDPKLN